MEGYSHLWNYSGFVLCAKGDYVSHAWTSTGRDSLGRSICEGQSPFRVRHPSLLPANDAKAAAELLRIPRSTISDLIHSIVTRVRAGHKIRDLTLMGVDEISYCKGHKYATIVYDLKRARWYGSELAREATCWRVSLKTKLSKYQRTKVKFACCDMSKAYISTIEKWLKKTVLIVDIFHIVKALNEAMDEVRKQEWRRVSKSKRLALKGIRWILFRHSSNRTKGQTRIINKLRHANNRIYRAWLLKDELEHFWGIRTQAPLKAS